MRFHAVVVGDHVRGITEDLFIDLSENAGVGAEGRGDLFALSEEGNCTSEETFQNRLWNELSEA